MATNNLSLIRRLKTKAAADAFTEGVNTLLATSLTSRARQIKALEKKITPAVAEALSEILPTISSNHKTEYLIDLKNQLQTLKVITITLAFDPSNEIIDLIYQKLSDQIGTEFLLNFEKDPSILGGIVISYEGKYKDLSIKKQIGKVFEKKKGEIAKILNS